MSGKSTRVRISRLNGPQGGGPKKAGLAPLTNIPNSVVRYLRLRGVTTTAPTAGTTTAGTCVTKEVTGGTFTTQAQLNTLNGCTKINGNLTISGFNSTAPDFSVFSCLKEITGNFDIYSNNALTTISGFSNLVSIGDYFNIQNNDALTTISSFSSLTTIVGLFYILSNGALTTISSFSSLVSVGSSFNIIDNGELTTISSFSSLVSIGDNFIINSNNKLTTISSFSSLVSVGGNFTISYNGGTATSSGSPNYITTTISSSFEALRATPSKGIGGTTRITGADSTHKISIPSAAVTKITAASTTITDITTNVVVV